MTPQPADRAFQLAIGYRSAQAVHVAVELGLPDLLAEGPRSVEELSAATAVDRDRLRRLLRALAALGVADEGDDGRYANTEVGHLFREGVPGSRRAMVRMLMPHSYRAWEHLLETVRSGATGQSLAYGRTLWEQIAADPEFRVRFNDAMSANSEGVAQFVAASGHFAHASVVVDVGGGEGSMVAGVLLAHANLRGVVYDLAAGLAQTSEYLASRHVIDRCEIVEGNFFESVPAGDVYLLKDILHDWDDERAGRILGVIRRAMNPGARVMVVERVLPSHITENAVHLNAAMADLHMMVLLSGRERTVEEIAALFATAGLALDRFTPGSIYHLVEAVAS
ncbi:MAG TPA: methyltransferase [Candidatus Limnocylindrales bacterium]|nr:methyltransferase [Candidatus Limnocylindrales bacterium]